MADAFGNVSFSVLDSDDDACSLFPLPLMRDLGQDSLKEWLDTRVVPKNRRFADKILAQAGLTPGDTMGIIDVCLALSINDAYWVVPEGFADTFVAYNLFDNELDEALALTAYTGYPSPSTAARGFRPNGPPTASTRRPGEGSTMRSSCSKPARKGMPTPAWSPIRSSSPRRPPKHSASPLWTTIWRNGRESSLRSARSCTTRTPPSCRSGPQPGSRASPRTSLRRRGFPRRHYEWPRKVGSQTPAGSNLPFNQVLQVVMTERHREALRRMLSFELTNHPVYPVDEERLDALNRLLGARVRQMLAIEPTSSVDVLARIEGTLPKDAFVPAAAVGV